MWPAGTCRSVRQSNWSARVLDPREVVFVGVELRLEGQVLPVESRRLGQHRGSRKARDAIHDGHQHAVEQELDCAEGE